jgi:hypothetical protein
MVQLAMVDNDYSPFGYRPSNDRPIGPVAAPAGVSARLVHAICELRRSRHEFIPGKLVGDCAWDILLRLYAAYLDQHRLSIARLTRATGIPATTLLRRLGSLEHSGLVGRRDDPTDDRRVFVELSDSGADAMRRFFAASGTRAIFV